MDGSDGPKALEDGPTAASASRGGDAAVGTPPPSPPEAACAVALSGISVTDKDDDDDDDDDGREGRCRLHLPPGVAPVGDFTSMFCSVSAVALTLLATTLPLEGTTREEERRIHKSLLYYVLWCVYVCGLWQVG
jgi:hypothetical protein